MTQEPLKGNPLFADREVLRGQIAALGLDIPLEPEIREMLAPVEIGGRKVGNRFVMHPMEGCDATLDGKPDEMTVRRFVRFAQGGAKMIWGEATAVAADGRANTRQLYICDENFDDFARLIGQTREAHRREWGTADDLLIGLQLTHSGRFSFPNPRILFHEPAVDATAKVGRERAPLPADYPVMTDDELDRLQDDYIAAVKLAKRAGVDFVGIKQCHRYLLSEMLAAKKRPGKYGGSLENRTRFVREVMGRIRSEVGREIIIGSRINLFDGVPYVTNAQTGMGEPAKVDIPFHWAFGTSPENPLEPDLAEPIEAVRLFRGAGLQLLNVSAGCPYYNFHIGRPADTPPPDGYGLPEHGLEGVQRQFDMAAEIQRSFPDLPVVGTGYSYLRQYAAEAAEANVRAGRITLVGFGRGAIAYPDFVADIVRSGAMDRKKVCITVSYCTSLMRAKDNELGQYACGCVPRDPVYAKLYQEVQRKKKAGGS